MAGKVRKLIDELIALRTQGSPAMGHFVRVNLHLRVTHQPRRDAGMWSRA
jgi:hypothetical protein